MKKCAECGNNYYNLGERILSFIRKEPMIVKSKTPFKHEDWIDDRIIVGVKYKLIPEQEYLQSQNPEGK